jgi:PAS domain S-box-containing protein
LQLAHNELAQLVNKRTEKLEDYQKRIENIVSAILKYTVLDFSQKVPVSAAGDEIDAIAAGMNTLSEELKMRMQKLQESEERFRQLVENVKDYAIFRVDANGRIASWNSGAQHIKGYSADEILGKHISIFYNDEEIERGEPEYNLEQARKLGRYENEGLRVKKNGEEFWADVILTALYDKNKNLTGFVKITRDITDKKLAEERLKASENFLESVVENLPNMLFVKDAETLRFIKINRAGERLLGYSRDELIGKNDHDFFPKKQADFFAEKDRLVLENGHMEEIPEEMINTKNMGIRRLETKKIPIYNENGKPKYLLGISNDITDRKRTEIELKLKSEELARSNAELEQFAYVASHSRSR